METCEHCAALVERLCAFEMAAADATANADEALRLVAVAREFIRATHQLERVLEENRRDGAMGGGHHARIAAAHELSDCRWRAYDAFVAHRLADVHRYVNLDDVAGFIESFHLPHQQRDEDLRRVIAARIRSGEYRRGLLVGDTAPDPSRRP